MTWTRPHTSGSHLIQQQKTGFEDCPLLLLYGEKAVTQRKRALQDAERHRRHMESVSEAMARHDVDEAEAAFKVCEIVFDGVAGSGHACCIASGEGV